MYYLDYQSRFLAAGLSEHERQRGQCIEMRRSDDDVAHTTVPSRLHRRRSRESIRGDRTNGLQFVVVSTSREYLARYSQ
jgi:hypothetical protein